MLKLFLVLLSVLVISLVGFNDAFAITAGPEYTPTQPNALASYDNVKNQITVTWNFDNLPVNTTCLLKGDFVWYEDLNDKHTTGVSGVDWDKVTGFIPLQYAVVSPTPVTINATTIYTEVIPCTDGNMRIDIDTIMNHSLNINNYKDLEIFLSFYVANADGSLSTANASRIDEVFVMYTSSSTFDNVAQKYGCGGQIGSTLYIDQSGIHGSNGDNCDDGDFKYLVLDPFQWVEIQMDGSSNPTPKGTETYDFHDGLSQLLFKVGLEPTQQQQKKSGGGCSGDCTPPTFGEDKHGRLLVSNGFELNGNATDVTDFHVDYDLITVNTNQTHNMKLKVYESTALRWIQVGFGIPYIGDSMNDAEAIVLFRIGYDDILDDVEITEKHTLVDITRASLNSTIPCSSFINSDCYLLDFDFIPRDQFKNNVVLIQAVDVYGYSNDNYINDGMLVVGESMNVPLESQVSVSKGGAFYPQRAGTVTLTLIDYKTDSWQDEYGYLWTRDNYKSFRIVDTIPVPQKEPDLMWNAMTRINDNFPAMIIYEQEKAVLIFDSSKLSSELGETFAYDLPKTDAEKQAELEIRIAEEIQRVTPFTKDYTKNQHLYQKDSYNHWNYFGDMSIAEINQMDLEKQQRLQDELYQQRLADKEQYSN